MANVAEQILFNESEGLELKLKTNAGLLFGFVYLDHARRWSCLSKNFLKN